MSNTQLSDKKTAKLRFMIAFVLGTMAACAIIALPATANAITVTVNTTLDTQDVTPGDTICADALSRCSLRAAITEANSSPSVDTIVIPAGTYTIMLAGANENNNVGGDFDILRSVTIMGAGAGMTNIEEPNGATEGVIDIMNGAMVNISGVTIRNGNTSLSGGGIRLGGTNTSLTLNDSVVTNNRAAGNGGGIALGTGGEALHINTSTISNNSAGGSGGGIYEFDATDRALIDLANSFITGNSVSSSQSSTFGGGLFASGTATTVTITVTTFSNNSAFSTSPGGAGQGGGIFNMNGTFSVRNSMVMGNTANIHAGIANLATIAAAIMTVTNTTISNNMATGNAFFAAQGGGVYNGSSAFPATMNITGSTINNNSATGQTGFAGGVYNKGLSGGLAAIFLTDDTVSGNSAHDAGGLYAFGPGQITVDWSTIVGNTAVGNGGNAYVDDRSIIEIIADIFFGGAAPGAPFAGPDLYKSGTGQFTSQGYNLFGTISGSGIVPLATDTVGANPLLGPLANNGGPTPTMLPGPGSPVLDRVPNGTNGCSPTATDQRGLTRLSGSGCDIGSVEVQVPQTTVSVGGRVFTSDGRGLRNATVTITGPNGYIRQATTSSFGFYSFTDVLTGQTYTIRVSSRFFRFQPQTLFVTGDLMNADFNGLE